MTILDVQALESVSDAVDEGVYRSHAMRMAYALLNASECPIVNKWKGTATNAEWTASSEFDAEKDKTTFRQYEDACERVKTFYREQHGEDRSF